MFDAIWSSVTVSGAASLSIAVSDVPMAPLFSLLRCTKKPIRKQTRLNQQRGSALLTSVLLLATTILLIDSYLDAYQHVIKINQLLANYLWGG